MICNITTRSDSDFVRSFLYKTIAGVAIDLTGSKLAMMLRQHPESPTVFLDLNTDNGRIELKPGTTGEFKLTILIEDFEQKLYPGEYVHSLIRTRPDKMHEEIWHGTLAHSMGPTR
ncbi:hypothetical protein ACVMGC_001004 [Bradyrhizobium barranii subsp. barranii]|uniref:hypothetical protein n=1 Tax=Bradyrhizobium TaxID=374 RepID=UPI001BA527BC|nr:MULTISPECIES: hypothetical protein [Bradyrhizobium]MBR0879606.1 hypothetical protein [Bradyrhizobium liaoningense]MCP1778842.1 hypothetical protein [Bradyrhizobium japonicum]MCP1958160.1 hypothetical protein [Bradyrhizobium japonicum]